MTDAEPPPVEPPAPAAPPAFDRAISPIAGGFGVGRGGKALALAALAAGCGAFLLATQPRARKAARPPEPARQVVPFEPLAPDARPPTLAAPGPGAPGLDGGDGDVVPALDPAANGASPDRDPAAQRQTQLTAVRAAPILAYSRGQAPAAAAEPADAVAAGLQAPADAASELDQLRRGSTIGRARATRLPDRNFLILAGTALPCLLQTAMDTAAPGYVSCLIPRDVLSDNGQVVLMEKGARVLGEYRSGMRQGQTRLFVLWTRAVTPGGVAVSLASPAADALGRAGFDGTVDSHFWDRFGGALLLSVVDDGAYAVAGRGRDGGAARLPSDAAGIALQNSVNIPPSLRKAQGSEVSILVAQDLDFSGVYGLKAR